MPQAENETTGNAASERTHLFVAVAILFVILIFLLIATDLTRRHRRPVVRRRVRDQL